MIDFKQLFALVAPQGFTHTLFSIVYWRYL